jgi:hypothetical protein
MIKFTQSAFSLLHKAWFLLYAKSLGTLGTDGTAVSIVAFIFYALSPLSLPLTDTLFIFSCSIRSKKDKYI